MATKHIEDLNLHNMLSKGVLVLPDLFLNAGGVTVSYFEWGKNLHHMRFGRLEKRLDSHRTELLLKSTEDLVGQRFPAAVRDALGRGASERDLVNSGLEETMITAFGEILDVKRRRRKVQDLRTAAYIVAIDKIAKTYLELGIFP